MAANEIHLDRGYRPKEAWKLLGVKRSTFWAMAKEGRIATTKISPRVTIVQGREILRILSGE